jgi:hypothetical protein
MQHLQHQDQDQATAGSAGFSMIATVLSLLATALLVAILLSTTLHSGSNSNASISNAPGVAEADGLQAQQALSTGLSAASTAAAGAGGYGAVTTSELSGSEPSVAFVSGPSSNSSTISVAVSPGQIQGVTGGPSGSITMADRSTDGTCWLVWKSTEATWYGAQTGLSSCSAPAIAAAPPPGSVSSSSIGWTQGTFPSA